MSKKIQKLSKIVKRFQKLSKMFSRSCFLVTLIKSLKGHKSLALLFNVKIKRCLTQSVSEWVSDKVTYWAVCGQLKKNHFHILCVCRQTKEKSLTKQTNPCKTWAHTELAKFYIINNKIVPNGSRKNKVLVAWE